MTYTTSIGKAQITALCVAETPRTVDELAGLFPSVRAEELASEVDPHGAVKWTFTLLLIRAGDETVLVDTGFSFGPGGPGAGTEELIEEAGVSAEQVNTILLTHGHGDHTGGLSVGDAGAFPAARLVMHRHEYRFWTGEQGGALYGEERVAGFRASVAPYRDRLSLIDDGEVILEEGGIRLTAMHAPGHTPGHTAFDLNCGEDSLWILGDAVHAQFQLHHPGWSPLFDASAELARRTSCELFARAADRKVLVHLFHFPFPGLGRIVRDGEAYDWLPLPADPDPR
jgi:glyoxylase-like metal-dependent hydrolase (beta-lactamase superfamily II)